MVAAERQTDVRIDKKVASLQVPDSEVKPVFAAKQVIGAPKAIGASGADGNHPLMPPSPVEMADARAGSPLAEVVPGRAKDALAEPQNDSSENSMNAPSSRSRSMAGSVSDVAIPASLAPRWTLSSDGTLQRSLDSGATWQTVVVSSKTVFRALAANDLDIWVGGSAGALFHSSDAGEHWTRVQPVANGEALEDDIVGVEFTDTLHGKLTSSAEETWITADAGQTWQKE
jgi:Photosynthesis system II assembly factor YCF48